MCIRDSYTIGSEMKTNTQKEWMGMAGNSITVALTGKLLPQTLVFFVMGTFYNAVSYTHLDVYKRQRQS